VLRVCDAGKSNEPGGGWTDIKKSKPIRRYASALGVGYHIMTKMKQSIKEPSVSLDKKSIQR